MSELDWYKNAPESCTALVFGEVFPDRAPVTNNILLGQKAYEGFQLYAYMDALLLTRHDPKYICWTPGFAAVYAGIQATGATQVVELGSTLFHTIDKLQKLGSLVGKPKLALEYIGVEPSELFSRVAEAIHPGEQVKHLPNLENLQPANRVTRCYQSTSYAFDTTEQLIEHCAIGAFGSHGLWCSPDGQTRNVKLLGKSLTLFSIPDLVKGLGARGYKVQFVANAKATRLNEFDYLETWLVCHRFTTGQQASFDSWLDRLSVATGEKLKLYERLEDVPLKTRTDAAFDGKHPSELFNFTSPGAINRLEAWTDSFKEPSFAQRLKQKVKAVIRG